MGAFIKNINCSRNITILLLGCEYLIPKREHYLDLFSFFSSHFYVRLQNY